ncbi:hypothetical protein IR152_01085 [Clostridioides sp. ES-S-0108-01]|uniref:hypothetical protein n=1 Tax=unclassified Clostridioides TaxID=2635829 RepID=UPI001D0CB43F|nr:hypothetical protein [Clostridioides sp. ES-S-0171-01]MCC0687919.1 hypothetical protein [Clostridioides sp. ES-S-0056-01]MCC0714599.1 hypothetical protein [Clostridioides sp. ES-S-0077-01]MCC0781748.1 hypothetical protein [Clostridioides sp. ES-S-0108-01]UDN49948.1 hypothetical protein JJC16_11255 [Clostridioides sp. ES-S-0107-01]UDN53409.1 hypothetical protein JJC02_10880 [Clostridioides sp. ES-S-0054-01]
MRIQQKKDNIYVKGLDKVDAYLINVIQRYFEYDGKKVLGSKEQIIDEVIQRVKEDLILAQIQDLLEEFLLKKGISFEENKVIITNKDLIVINGQIREDKNTEGT